MIRIRPQDVKRNQEELRRITCHTKNYHIAETDVVVVSDKTLQLFDIRYQEKLSFM